MKITRNEWSGLAIGFAVNIAAVIYLCGSGLAEAADYDDAREATVRIAETLERIEGVGRYQVVFARGQIKEEDCLILLDTVTGRLEKRYVTGIQ